MVSFRPGLTQRRWRRRLHFQNPLAKAAVPNTEFFKRTFFTDLKEQKICLTINLDAMECSVVSALFQCISCRPTGAARA